MIRLLLKIMNWAKFRINVKVLMNLDFEFLNFCRSYYKNYSRTKK